MSDGKLKNKKERAILTRNQQKKKPDLGKYVVEGKLPINWQEYKTRSETIDKVSDKVMDFAVTNWQYYSYSIPKFRKWSKFFTVFMIIFLFLGIILEIGQLALQSNAIEDYQALITQVINENNEEKLQSILNDTPVVMDLTSYGLIALALAYAMLLFDKNFGVSSTYLRYMNTKLKLNHLISDFTDLWQIKTAAIFQIDAEGKIIHPSEENEITDLNFATFNELRQIIESFKNEVETIVQAETKEWIDLMSKSRKELEGLITKKYEELKKEREQRNTDLLNKINEEKKKYQAENFSNSIDIDLQGIEKYEKGTLKVLTGDTSAIKEELALKKSSRSLTIPNLSAGVYTIALEVEDINKEKVNLSQSVDLTATKIGKIQFYL